MQYSLVAIIALLSLGAHAQEAPKFPDGTSYKITVIEADGFVGKGAGGSGEYDGYIVDMIKTISESANFAYELVTPSGFGSNCSPQLDVNTTEGINDAKYASSYLCGQDDVLEEVPTDSQTDMYWSLYFVSTSRQLAGKFSLPFKPPFGGLTMYGTATGITDVDDLIAQQKAGDQKTACVGDNTAYANFLTASLPDLKTVSVPNTDAGFLAALEDGTCEVAIGPEPSAGSFVRHRKDTNTCEISGDAIGVIGEGLKYGLTQMAVGFGKDMDQDVIDTISYWLNVQMTCAPGSAVCAPGLYTSWLKWAGTGDECGYESGDGGPSGATMLTSGATTVLGAVVVGMIGFLFV